MKYFKYLKMDFWIVKSITILSKENKSKDLSDVIMSFLKDVLYIHD